MGDYHEVYLLTDTLLLADVFENFCKICLATYDLDLAHYYSAPGLAWDAALKSTQIKLDAETGYILEVDLEYPQRPHDTHNDYPLVPETMKISQDMLSPYSQLLAVDLQYCPGGVEKFLPNLHNKTKYILHYGNLKLYLELGMKLTKIQQVLQFKQAAWQKPYIDLNTQKRPKRVML